MCRMLLGVGVFCLLGDLISPAFAEDRMKQIQESAIADRRSEVMYWGTDPDRYSNWTNHSNRLIPVYTFGTKNAGDGIDLKSFQGAHSPYRSEAALRKIYGRVPENTVNPEAEYFDQSQIGEIQKTALKAGKKHIFLVVFDGMDWQTTRAAALYQTGDVKYESGRGTGLHLQDYTAGGTTQFGWVVTSPHNTDAKANVNSQEVTRPGGSRGGGYNVTQGGAFPWSEVPEKTRGYLIGKSLVNRPAHAVPDSAATATAMCSGIKTYNGSIGVSNTGEQLTTVAHLAQEQGRLTGIVTSVPISHATPASAYAHNVTRNDYQDITRDLLGLPSVSHPQPLRGLDVVIGAGWGKLAPRDSGQGENFVPGNKYLTQKDLQSADVEHGGKYQVAVRTTGKTGNEVLQSAAETAIAKKHRLLGFFGTASFAHLPFRTANGDYNPARGVKYPWEQYSPEDITENPTLAEMTSSAIRVLSANSGEKGFWLMVEAGDVDWANHDNNLDCSIGAVLSGNDAVKTITDWVEQHSSWEESLLIVTADHGHYLHIKSPESIANAGKTEKPAE